MNLKNLMMKQLNSIVFLVGIILALNANAQITIEKSDMPSTGNMIRTSTGLNVDFINYQKTGEDYVWDFSQLTPISQSVDTFVGMTDVPPFIALYFLSSANMAKKDNTTIPIPNYPISKQFSFVKKTSSSYNNAGVLYTISGFPVPLKYNSPDVLYRFPMEYGNEGNSFAEYSLGLENTGHIRKEVGRTNLVDGWGNLTTPYGTFDVLRIKSEVTEYDSIYVDSLGIGFPLYREYTEYSWLGKNQKLPLLKIVSSFGGAIATYVDSVRSLLAINNVNATATFNVKVFPNPTSDIINITTQTNTTSKINIYIYDSNGKLVAARNTGLYNLGKADANLSLRELGLKNGVYFLKITNKNSLDVKRIVLY